MYAVYIGKAVQTVTPPDGSVSESKLQVSNSPTNGYVLSAQSAASGGLTWAADAAGTITAFTNGVDNRVVTATSATALNGETNFIYNGTIVGCGADGANADLGVGLHIKTADSGATANGNANNFVIESSGNVGMSLLGGSSDNQRICFGDSEDDDVGRIMYNHSLNYMNFNTNATTAMTIDSAGIVTKPLQPTFLVNVSSDSVHPNLPTGVTIIDFGSEAYDVGNNVSSVGVFTAPVTGKYQFNTSMAFADITTSTTLLEVFIKASNREMRGCLQNVANLQAGDYQSFGFSTMVDMDASDTCFVQVAITGGGGTIDVISGSTPAPLSFFSGTLIC
jgi:hypothetical protein